MHVERIESVEFREFAVFIPKAGIFRRHVAFKKHDDVVKFLKTSKKALLLVSLAHYRKPNSRDFHEKGYLGSDLFVKGIPDDRLTAFAEHLSLLGFEKITLLRVNGKGMVVCSDREAIRLPVKERFEIVRAIARDLGIERQISWRALQDLYSFRMIGGTPLPLENKPVVEWEVFNGRK